MLRAAFPVRSPPMKWCASSALPAQGRAPSCAVSTRWKRSGGEIEVNGFAVHDQKPTRNKMRESVGMVFQRFNLFPHMTVLENIIMAPVSVKKLPRAEAITQAEQLLRKVGLFDKIDAYPNSLSGGQQQGWRSPARWRWNRRSCCSTNRPPRSIRSWWAKYWQ